MKRIVSLFLTIILCASGVLTVQAMDQNTVTPAVQGNASEVTMETLGMPKDKEHLALVQKRDQELKEAADKKAAATAAIQQNPSMQAEIKKQADNKPVQKKKVRSLIDLLQKDFAMIPSALWINHIASFSDYASSIFPIQLTPMHGTLDNLKYSESWQNQEVFCESTAEATSSDGQLYAITTINKIPEHVFMVGLHLKGFILEMIIMDLKTRKRIGSFKTEIEAPPGLWYRYTTTWAEAKTSFVHGNTLLYVSGDFTVEGANLNTPHINLLFDLTEFKFNKKFQEAWANTLTPQQSILLMLLDGLQKKNNNKPISLLHDIALKEMLSLKELQDTLASFHPLITQSIIKRYAIIDPTPQASREVALKVKADHVLKLKKASENKSYWMNVAKKITGATAVVATIGALRWYLKKK